MYNLAHLNIAKARFAFGDPRIADFVNAIQAVNGAAERSDGCVWRLDTGPVSETPPIVYGDPTYVVNLSVWCSVEALRRFVTSRAHLAIMRRRAEWFEELDVATLVLWWVRDPEMPTVAGAEARLDQLRADGPTNSVFSFARTFPPPVADQPAFAAAQHRRERCQLPRRVQPEPLRCVRPLAA